MKKEKPKKTCQVCRDEVYHPRAKFCRKHSPAQKAKRAKYAKGGGKRKTRGLSPLSKRIKLILTLDELSLLLKKLDFPALDVEIRR